MVVARLGAMDQPLVVVRGEEEPALARSSNCSSSTSASSMREVELVDARTAPAAARAGGEQERVVVEVRVEVRAAVLVRRREAPSRHILARMKSSARRAESIQIRAPNTRRRAPCPRSPAHSTKRAPSRRAPAARASPAPPSLPAECNLDWRFQARSASQPRDASAGSRSSAAGRGRSARAATREFLFGEERAPPRGSRRRTCPPRARCRRRARSSSRPRATASRA